MSQDNRNRDEQNQDETPREDVTRAGRSPESGSSQPDPSGTRNPNPVEGADMDELDELDDDEDRDEDDRIDGGQNRRRSIS